MGWQTRAVRAACDTLAPDGSEIRRLACLARGSLVHCTLPAGCVTQAVRHRTVEELWYCVGGVGAVWRRDADGEEVVDLRPGVSVSIPLGTTFQFRANGAAPLEVVIATMPPWPGADEAVPVEGTWSPALRPPQ